MIKLFVCFFLVSGAPLVAETPACAPCKAFRPFAPVAPNLLEERDLYQGVDGELEIGLSDFLNFGGFLSFPKRITGKVKAGYQDKFTSPQLIQFVNSCKCNHYTTAIGQYKQIDTSLPAHIRSKMLGQIMVELGEKSESCVERYFILLQPTPGGNVVPTPPRNTPPHSPSPPRTSNLPNKTLPQASRPCSPQAKVKDQGSNILIWYDCEVTTTAFIRYKRGDSCHDDVKELIINFANGFCTIPKASLGSRAEQPLSIEVLLTPKNKYKRATRIGSNAYRFAR